MPKKANNESKGGSGKLKSSALKITPLRSRGGDKPIVVNVKLADLVKSHRKDPLTLTSKSGDKIIVSIDTPAKAHSAKIHGDVAKLIDLGHADLDLMTPEQILAQIDEAVGGANRIGSVKAVKLRDEMDELASLRRSLADPGV